MNRDTCYFDGQCGLCKRSRAVLSRLDWLGRLEWKDMNAVSAAELPVLWEQAMAGMPMRTREGRALCGYRAVRRALLQTPLGFLPALLLYVPGFSWLAERVYKWIAARRRQGCEPGGTH